MGLLSKGKWHSTGSVRAWMKKLIVECNEKYPKTFFVDSDRKLICKGRFHSKKKIILFKMSCAVTCFQYYVTIKDLRHICCLLELTESWICCEKMSNFGDHSFTGSDNYYTTNVFNYSFRNKLLSLFPCHTLINRMKLIILSSFLKNLSSRTFRTNVYSWHVGVDPNSCWFPISRGLLCYCRDHFTEVTTPWATSIHRTSGWWWWGGERVEEMALSCKSGGILRPCWVGIYHWESEDQIIHVPNFAPMFDIFPRNFRKDWRLQNKYNTLTYQRSGLKRGHSFSITRGGKWDPCSCHIPHTSCQLSRPSTPETRVRLFCFYCK